MTRSEFITSACRMGYCTRPQAEMYCVGKENFTDDDYIKVFEMAQESGRKFGGVPLYGGGKTTKRYFREDD